MRSWQQCRGCGHHCNSVTTLSAHEARCPRLREVVRVTPRRTTTKTG